MIVKGLKFLNKHKYKVAGLAGITAAYEIGKDSEKKKKKVEDKKLNRALTQHFNAMRSRRG